MRRSRGWRPAAAPALAAACAAACMLALAPRAAGGQAGALAAATVSAAIRAAEADGGAAHAEALRARLARDPHDRLAALGLATVARLTYGYPLADSLLATLLARPAGDAIDAYALLGRAQALGARGFVTEADSVYARAADAARATAAPTALAEALLGRAGTRGRALGSTAALATLDSAEAAIAAAAGELGAREHGAADLARLRAVATCGRATIRTRAGAPGVMALIDSGVALAGHAAFRTLGMCQFARAQEHARHGAMAAAYAALDTAAALLRRTGDRATLAGTLQWRGYALLTVGSFEAAQRDLASALAEATAGEALLPMGWALINVGQIAASTGALGDAAGYFGRAEAILARIGDTAGVVTARTFLAGLALQRGDVRAARERYGANRRWAERAGDWILLCESLRGLSQVALREGDRAAAVALLDSANALVLRHGGQRWAPSNAWNRGALALQLGDGARAERELGTALPSYLPSQGSSRYRLRAGIAHARLLQGDTAGAAAELREASDALDAWRASLGTDRLRAAVYQLRDVSRDPPSSEVVIAGVAAAGRVAAAFDLAERRRARMLRDALLRAAPTRGAPADGAGTSGGAATVDAIAAALPDARSALALVVAGVDGAPGTLFVVTRAGAAAHLLPPDDSLARLADRLRARVEDGVDASAPARALGEALFGARGAWLPRGLARLVVVPDGSLHDTPLALLDPDGHGPLGERVAVSVAPSATVATLLWGRPRDAERLARPARVLAFGDPAFPHVGDGAAAAPAGGDATGADRRALARLPRSGDEARAAARMAPGSRVLLGAEASEAALRAPAVREYGVVHLATHAYVDDSRPWASLVVLAPGAGHDGFVRASELAALPLAADLVVLSACETAGGQVVGGEGVQGFAAALLASGVRAVVATRWALRDGEAEQMMAAFYRALGDGLAADEALQRARRELRRAGAPARAWAAFTLVGDGSVRMAPVRRGSWLARLFGAR